MYPLEFYILQLSTVLQMLQAAFNSDHIYYCHTWSFFFNLIKKSACWSIDNTVGKSSFELVMVPAHI